MYIKYALHNNVQTHVHISLDMTLIIVFAASIIYVTGM